MTLKVSIFGAGLGNGRAGSVCTGAGILATGAGAVDCSRCPCDGFIGWKHPVSANASPQTTKLALIPVPGAVRTDVRLLFGGEYNNRV